MRFVSEHAAAHMTARSFSFCHGDNQCCHETRRGGTTGSMADFGVRTDSHAGLIRAGLKMPSFPYFGRDYVGAVEGEQSVRLSPATARRENPRPFGNDPQPSQRLFLPRPAHHFGQYRVLLGKLFAEGYRFLVFFFCMLLRLFSAAAIINIILQPPPERGSESSKARLSSFFGEFR